MEVRLRTKNDLAGCVSALEAVHRADGYPTWWPVDPAGWLSPSGCAAAWVAHDDVMGSILGHVCIVRGVDDPMVASLISVSTGAAYALILLSLASFTYARAS